MRPTRWTRRRLAAVAGGVVVIIAGLAVAAFALAPSVALAAPPANDAFPGQTISGAPLDVAGTNVDATCESGEPAHDTVWGCWASVWYSWTAPASGSVEIDLCTSTFASELAVYTGATVLAGRRLGELQGDERFLRLALGMGVLAAGRYAGFVAALLLGAGLTGPAVLATDALATIALDLCKAALFQRFDLLDGEAFFTGVVIGAATLPGSALAAWLVTRVGAKLHVLFMEALILAGGAFMLWHSWR
jgi:hypothetical protein